MICAGIVTVLLGIFISMVSNHAESAAVKHDIEILAGGTILVGVMVTFVGLLIFCFKNLI